MSNISTKAGRVFHLPDDEEDVRIRAGIAADPNTHELTKTEMTTMRRRVGRPPAAVVRPMLSLRVDADVAAALRASGKGWQTRVNALLRQSLEHGGLKT